jgi:hypothetical protein
MAAAPRYLELRISAIFSTLDEPWKPEQHGFEFSSRELNLWMDRRELIKQAREFDFHGCLPEEHEENEEPSETDDNISDIEPHMSQ